MNLKHRSRTSGSAIAVILVFAIAVGAIVASLFSWATTESRISISNELSHEARLAVESVIEHGMSQLHARFLAEASVAPWEFDPNSNLARPLTLRPDFYTLMNSTAETRLILPSAPYRPSDPLDHPTAVVAGVSPINTTFAVIDRAIPGNELTEHMGSAVDVREIEIYGRATVDHPRFGTRSAFARQRFQILEDSLFAYGIFFDGDMTFSPGENMTFAEGAIHSNGNAWLGANRTLNLRARITIAGLLTAGREDQHTAGTVGTTGGTINIRNASTGNNISLSMTASDEQAGGPGLGWTGFLQSAQTNFRDIATNRFAGNLQTGEHGVSERSPVGFEEMSNLFTGGDGNIGYHMIMPPANQNVLNSTELTEEQRQILATVEGTKLSSRSGFTIELDTSSGTPQVRTFTFERDAAGGLIYGTDGEPRVIEIPIHPDFEFWTIEEYARSGNDLSGGLFDFREANNDASNTSGERSLLRINVEALAEFIEADVNALDADDNPIFAEANVADATPGTFIHPSRFHNGGIFVRMPEDPPATARNDLVVPALRNWAVDLHNGNRVPNPDYLRQTHAGARTPLPGNDDPSFGRAPVYGMTLATNSAVYITGDFNVPDGAGTSSAPADTATFGRQQGSEAAVAIAADAITLLSNNWNRLHSRRTLANRTPTNTTYSAAFITGVVPLEGTNYSGGVENFPRFLESWTNSITTTIRGSFISLFNSEVNTGRWTFGGNIYTAPSRLWGYNTAFLAETRPPIFRNMRGYRRVYFEEISETAYQTNVSRILAEHVAARGGN